MAYKEKECPKCGVKHNKRGQFCSRSCGNTRVHKPETKALLSQKQSEWMTSGDDRADVAVYNFISQGNNKPSEPIAPIRQVDMGNRFVQDGDLWEEV